MKTKRMKIKNPVVKWKELNEDTKEIFFNYYMIMGGDKEKACFRCVLPFNESDPDCNSTPRCDEICFSLFWHIDRCPCTIIDNAFEILEKCLIDDGWIEKEESK